MTTIGVSRRSSALRSTNRVCGSGPSDASTSSMHAVDHRQRPLHLAAEIGVARRVDDVDQGAVIVDRGVLGQDRDAALALELVAVHGALGDALVGAEDAALMQQGVDERRLAVVDVGDDGDVAPQRVGDLGATGEKKAFRR